MISQTHSGDEETRVNSFRDASVGIVAVGAYVPQSVMTAADIAAASGIEEWVIREKFGITQKRVPGPDDHTNQMAVWAAQDCLAKCDVKPDEIDVYRSHRTSFMFNLAAGGGALLLRRGWPVNHVLGSHLMSDGYMSEHVIVPASGTK
jgi:3-oxoacyl-[acyl-carrier-protein] synthase III